MGACRSCGANAGALKSLCAACKQRQAEEAAAERARIAQEREALDAAVTARMGVIGRFAGVRDVFKQEGDRVGEGIDGMPIYDPTDDGRMKEVGALSLTSTGMLITVGRQYVFYPRTNIRHVFADVGYHNGHSKDWTDTYTFHESHFCWIQIHDKDLQSFQVQFPYEPGVPASLKVPALFLMSVESAGIPVTVQNHSIQYVIDALGSD